MSFFLSCSSIINLCHYPNVGGTAATGLAFGRLLSFLFLRSIVVTSLPNPPAGTVHGIPSNLKENVVKLSEYDKGSVYCLTSMRNFSAISWREQVTFSGMAMSALY